MAQVPIHMPQLGESIAEATIVRFLFNEGDAITADAHLIEVETNKAVMEVAAPCSGSLCQIIAQAGEKPSRRRDSPVTSRSPTKRLAVLVWTKKNSPSRSPGRRRPAAPPRHPPRSSPR